MIMYMGRDVKIFNHNIFFHCLGFFFFFFFLLPTSPAFKNTRLRGKQALQRILHSVAVKMGSTIHATQSGDVMVHLFVGFSSCSEVSSEAVVQGKCKFQFKVCIKALVSYGHHY